MFLELSSTLSNTTTHRTFYIGNYPVSITTKTITSTSFWFLQNATILMRSFHINWSLVLELHQSSCSYQEPVSLSKLTRHYCFYISILFRYPCLMHQMLVSMNGNLDIKVLNWIKNYFRRSHQHAPSAPYTFQI